MDKLTEAEMAVLPEWAQEQYRAILLSHLVYGGSLSNVERKQKELLDKLARALTPLPCGHPPGCAVSVPYMGEKRSSNSCAWCAQLDRLNHYSGTLRVKIIERRDLIEEMEAERDALREKLEAAEGLAEALETVNDYHYEELPESVHTALAAWKAAKETS